MASTIVALACMLSLAAVARAYRSGAPSSACINMTPNHSTHSTQPNPAPYTITASVTEYRPNEAISVTITGNAGNNFKGFFLQAQQNSMPVGTFIAIPGQTKIVDCNGQQTLTHSQVLANTGDLTVQYIPPDIIGDIDFVITIVKEWSTFWVKLQGPTIPRFIDSAVMQPDCLCNLPVKEFNLAELSTQSYEVKWDPPSNGQIKFRVRGRVGYSTENKYVSIGFSEDEYMGDDSVIDCIQKGNSGSVEVQASYNTNTKINVLNNGGNMGLHSTSGALIDGVLECHFTRDISLPSNTQFFDLSSRTYRLFVASGSVGIGDIKQIHDVQATKRPVLSDVEINFLVSARYFTLS